MDTQPDKFTAFKAQALADCLEQIEAGASLEDVLKSYGKLASELRPLLETALANQAYASGLVAPTKAISSSRAKLLNAAQARGERSKASWLAGIFFSRLALAAAAFLLVLLAGGFSTAAASAQALPGDWLYPVKIAAEQTRLFLTPNPLARLKLEQTFDKRRADELLALQKANRSEVIRLGGEVGAIQPTVWDVRGIQVIIHSGTQLEPDIEIGFYVEVTGKLQADGTVIADTIRARKIEFTGTVESMGEESWVIDGLTVKVTGRTQWIGNPVTGSPVEVGAFVLADGSLQAHRIQVSGKDEAIATWTDIPTNTPTITPGNLLPSKPTLIPLMTEAPERNEMKSIETIDSPGDDSGTGDHDNDDENKEKEEEEKEEEDHSRNEDSSGKSPTNTPEPGE